MCSEQTQKKPKQISHSERFLFIGNTRFYKKFILR